jgi:hypothetical protein
VRRYALDHPGGDAGGAPHALVSVAQGYVDQADVAHGFSSSKVGQPVGGDLAGQERRLADDPLQQLLGGRQASDVELGKPDAQAVDRSGPVLAVAISLPISAS